MMWRKIRTVIMKYSHKNHTVQRWTVKMCLCVCVCAIDRTIMTNDDYLVFLVCDRYKLCWLTVRSVLSCGRENRSILFPLLLLLHVACRHSPSFSRPSMHSRCIRWGSDLTRSRCAMHYSDDGSTFLHRWITRSRDTICSSRRLLTRDRLITWGG